MSLKTFLKGRNNANVLEKTIAHVQKTLETVVEFERGFVLCTSEDDFILALEVLSRVHVFEKEADIIRRDLLIQISQSELSPAVREDFSHLIKHIDSIANTADAAASRLRIFPHPHILALGESIAAKIRESMHLTVESLKILFTLVRNLLTIDNTQTFKKCEQIQALEHQCDVLHDDIYGLLLHLPEIPFNPFEAILMKEFVDLVEAISDKIEDVSDYIQILKTAKL